VSLPASMEVGRYKVQLTRDGTRWVDMLREHGAEPRQLNVMPDPSPLPVVNVRDFRCDEHDDTTCIVEAITAAADLKKYPRGATVEFEARTYRLSDPGTWAPDSNASSKHVDYQGIWVPKHVSLQGRGMGATRIVRGTGWVTTGRSSPGKAAPVRSLFNLQGDNIVRGFTFDDENTYGAQDNTDNAALNLGIDAAYAHEAGLGDPRLSYLVISRNEFKLPFKAILGRGLPLDHLFITYNTIAAHEN